jgi:hypothetical protein
VFSSSSFSSPPSPPSPISSSPLFQGLSLSSGDRSEVHRASAGDVYSVGAGHVNQAPEGNRKRRVLIFGRMRAASSEEEVARQSQQEQAQQEQAQREQAQQEQQAAASTVQSGAKNAAAASDAECNRPRSCESCRKGGCAWCLGARR